MLLFFDILLSLDPCRGPLIFKRSQARQPQPRPLNKFFSSTTPYQHNYLLTEVLLRIHSAMAFAIEVPGEAAPLSPQQVYLALQSASSSQQGSIQTGTAQLQAWETQRGYYSLLQVRLTMPFVAIC